MSKKEEIVKLDSSANSISTSDMLTRGNNKVRDTLFEMLELFEVTPSGNIFKDFSTLSQKLEDANFFLIKIFDKIFDQYCVLFDEKNDGYFESKEMEQLLKDLGEAISDKSIENLSKKKLEEIMKEIDLNGNARVEREDLIAYFMNNLQKNNEIKKTVLMETPSKKNESNPFYTPLNNNNSNNQHIPTLSTPFQQIK